MNGARYFSESRSISSVQARPQFVQGRLGKPVILAKRRSSACFSRFIFVAWRSFLRSLALRQANPMKPTGRENVPFFRTDVAFASKNEETFAWNASSASASWGRDVFRHTLSTKSRRDGATNTSKRGLIPAADKSVARDRHRSNDRKLFPTSIVRRLPNHVIHLAACHEIRSMENKNSADHPLNRGTPRRATSLLFFENSRNCPRCPFGAPLWPILTSSTLDFSPNIDFFFDFLTERARAISGIVKVVHPSETFSDAEEERDAQVRP